MDYDASFQPSIRLLDDTDSTELCPTHAKQRQEKEKLRKKDKKKAKGCCACLCTKTRMLGKNTLQSKLLLYNIKHIRIKASRSNKVNAAWYGGDSESNDDKLLVASELGYLTESQLEEVIEVFEDRIHDHRKVLTEMVEERGRLTEDAHGLSLTMKRLQEVMLREMKPWVNILPESNELARVMLLN